MNELNIKRHSLAHILAQSIQRTIKLNVELGFGPNTDNGAYYDFDNIEIKEENLKDIQKKMEGIIKENQEFHRIEVNIDIAEKILNQLNQLKKVEYMKELTKKGENISLYINTINIAQKDIFVKNTISKGAEEYYNKLNELLLGFDNIKSVIDGKFVTFIDMCQGPHIESTKEIDVKSFKVVKLAGAYWKGDEKNVMMTRVYMYAMGNKEKLKEYLNFLEEAKKRDHRVLGKKLDLFCFSEIVGPGLPMFTPRGTMIIDLLQQKIEKICRDYGFEKVSTPHLAKIDLFKISGHADKYPEELFHVSSEAKQNYVMKPVQCPHQTQIYASKKRSYRDLPIRYMESNKQYRAEQAGEISGLNRVIAITVEDGHSFCRIDQIKDEIIGMVNIIKNFFTDLGLRGNHWVSLSLRDRKLDKYIGEDNDRKMAEKMLIEVSEEMGLNAKVCEGEAAVYGPKLDFMFKDSLGREIQIPTVQLDFATPKRFELKYTNEEGNEIPPVMIHRAILGSYERLLVLLIEHFAGAFPFRLAPEQIRIIPVVDKFDDYAKKVRSNLISKGYRVNIDSSDDSFSKKIRNGELMKIPYLFIVGEKEETDNNISWREYNSKDQGVCSLEEFEKKAK